MKFESSALTHPKTKTDFWVGDQCTGMWHDTEVKSKLNLSAIANGLIQGSNQVTKKLSLALQFQVKPLLEWVKWEYIAMQESVSIWADQK